MRSVCEVNGALTCCGVIRHDYGQVLEGELFHAESRCSDRHVETKTSAVESSMCQMCSPSSTLKIAVQSSSHRTAEPHTPH
jgi:hypothetical protein